MQRCLESRYDKGIGAKSCQIQDKAQQNNKDNSVFDRRQICSVDILFDWRK